MNQEELDIELIERHLKGLLTDEERVIFERKLKDDEEFAEKIEDYKAIIQGIQIGERDKFREEIAAWEKELAEEETSASSFSIKKYWPLAAAAALIIGAILYFYPSATRQDTQQLFTAYFEPYEDVISVRNEGEEDHLAAGMSYYNLKAYDQAITALSQYLQSHDRDDVRFYLGSAQLASGKTDDAIATFKQVLTTESIFKEQSEWYLALAHLSNKNKMQCKEMLSKIANDPNHFYQERAEALLDKL